MMQSPGFLQRPRRSLGVVDADRDVVEEIIHVISVAERRVMFHRESPNSTYGKTTIPAPGPYHGCMTNSMKMMWGCIAILVLAVILSVALANAVYLLFLIPCMLMMGAMVWMMMGGMGGGSRGRGKK